MSQSEIVVPKRRILIPRMVIRERRAPSPRVGVRLQPQHLRYEVGRYRERLRSGPGGLGRGRIWTPERVGEQHNLLLDQAFDLIASHGFTGLTAYAVVGTGSSAPSATDTGLAAEFARTNVVPSGSSDQITRVSDGVWNIQRTREFGASTVGGANLTEWGWAPSGTPNAADLAVRELFRDSGGTPVTLTLATDQALRLIYTQQVTITPVSAVAASLTLTNLGTLTGNFIVHAESNPGSGPKTDLDLINTLAQGGGSVGLGIYRGGLTYYLQYSRTAGSGKSLAFNPYTAGDRARSVGDLTWASGEAVETITDIAIGLAYYNTVAFNAVLELDSGQEIVKDNLHKLILTGWTIISW